MLQVKQNYIEKDGVVLQNNTTQYYNDGKDIVIKTKDKHGQVEQHEIPLELINDFQPYIDNKSGVSVFDKLNREFNMIPEEVTNPFIISSRYPQVVPRENRLVMPYESVPQATAPPQAQSKLKRKGTSKKPSQKSKTPRKKDSPGKKAKKAKKTSKNDKPYGNEIINVKSS